MEMWSFRLRGSSLAGDLWKILMSFLAKRMLQFVVSSGIIFYCLLIIIIIIIIIIIRNFI